MFKTIKENVSYELVEKKSKFIANLYYVESVEEAEEKIKQLKKKYYDARHNCYAFSIFTNTGKIDRFSDDGEPSGTAGAPMLNIINSQGLSNILVVVTRYFGGILLGTGGLVRAYSDATIGALENANKTDKDLGLIVKLTVSYADVEKIKYYFKQEDINIINNEFDENVNIFIEITKEKYNKILENKEEFNFKILSNNVIKESYISI